MLRGVRNNPLVIGDNVLVGSARLFDGLHRGRRSLHCHRGNGVQRGPHRRRAEVRVNGIVHLRTVLAEGATVPLGWITVGDPAEILPPQEHERIWAIQKSLDFPRYVFGVERPPEGQSIMPQVMPRYAKALLHHCGDRIVPE